MDFYLELVTPPTLQPVTLAEVKDQLRIPQTLCDDDLAVNQLIASVVKVFERMTNRVTMSRVLRLTTTAAGCQIELPCPPLVSLDSLESRDSKDDAWAAVASSDYDLESARTPPLIELDLSPVYVKAEYTAGYTAQSDVPSDWKMCIKQMLTFYHENPGDVKAEFPISLQGLIHSVSAGTVAGYWYT